MVDGPVQPHAVAEPGEALAGDVECCRVAVDADQAGLRAGVEDQAGVPAEAEGAVDVDGAGLVKRRGEQFDDACGQNRHVGVVCPVASFDHARPCLLRFRFVRRGSKPRAAGTWHRGR